MKQSCSGREVDLGFPLMNPQKVTHYFLKQVILELLLGLLTAGFKAVVVSLMGKQALQDNDSRSSSSTTTLKCKFEQIHINTLLFAPTTEPPSPSMQLWIFYITIPIKMQPKSLYLKNIYWYKRQCRIGSSRFLTVFLFEDGARKIVISQDHQRGLGCDFQGFYVG